MVERSCSVSSLDTEIGANPVSDDQSVLDCEVHD